MAIVVDTPLVHKSLSTFLLSITPDVNIYDNPNQQGTKIPAWFIVHRSPVSIVREIGRAWLTYEIDLFYMSNLNMTNTFDVYSSIADRLNTAFEYLPIFGTNFVTHVLDRSWALQLDCLRYSITLKFRVSRDTKLEEKMRVIESLTVFLKNQPIEPNFYPVKLQTVEHGYVTTSMKSTSAGSKVVVTAHPDDGYNNKELVVMREDGIELTPILDLSDHSYMFTMPDQPVLVIGIFNQNPPIPVEHDITIEYNQNGWITSNYNHAEEGTIVILKIHPKDGYKLKFLYVLSGGFVVDTESLDDEVIFEMPDRNVFIYYDFEAITP